MWTNIFETYVSDHVALVVHGYLLGFDVLATIAVGAGIIWEHGPPDVRKVADRLVVWGIVAETFCSIALFTFDEGISSAQQAKIIELETQIAPRSLNLTQCKDVANALASFSGKVIRIQSYAADSEGSTLAAEIVVCMRAEKTAKVDSALASISPIGGFGSGIFVDGSDKALIGAIKDALGTKANLLVSPGSGWFPGNMEISRPSEPPDANIVVGVKPIKTPVIK